MALRKKQLIAEGKLDKHGKSNEKTPPEYLRALGEAPVRLSHQRHYMCGFGEAGFEVRKHSVRAGGGCEEAGAGCGGG